MVKNLRSAKEYVNKIRKGLIKDPLVGRDWVDSLKLLAKAKDEKRFKIVVDSVCSSIKSKKSLKLYAKEPLALVESFCEVIDHPDQDELNHAVDEYKRILDGRYFNEPA